MDGKTKLQFPTGETAMEIEGLGEEGSAFWNLKPEDLEVGKIVEQGNLPGEWIITDILGDGKFKAVSKERWDEAFDGSIAGQGIEDDVTYFREQNHPGVEETFDISGKIDTSNPIYRFYEKEVGRFLTNKYGAKIVTDPQGVKWFEVNVGKNQAKEPILAHGKIGIPGLGGGALGGGLLAALTKGKKETYSRKDQLSVQIAEGIAHNETGGVKNPYTFAKPSGIKALGRDLGKYQITEAVLKQHSEKYLGRKVSSEEFLKSSTLQENFMTKRIQHLLDQGYTPEQIADFHRTGRIGEPGDKDYSSPPYVRSFLEAFRK